MEVGIWRTCVEYRSRSRFILQMAKSPTLGYFSIRLFARLFSEQRKRFGSHTVSRIYVFSLLAFLRIEFVQEMDTSILCAYKSVFRHSDVWIDD